MEKGKQTFVSICAKSFRRKVLKYFFFFKSSLKV